MKVAIDTVNVPIELVQAIANYLARRPWAEVNAFLVQLSALPAESEPTKDAVE